MKNFPIEVIERLREENAPLKEIELFGKYEGEIDGMFPKRWSDGTITSGDCIVEDNENGVRWVRLYEDLSQSIFNDRYSVIYMTYDNCIKYGVVSTVGPKVTKFNEEFSTKLQAASTEEDYNRLLKWVFNETVENMEMYDVGVVYEKIIMKNDKAIPNYIKTNPIVMENYLLSTIQKEVLGKLRFN